MTSGHPTPPLAATTTEPSTSVIDVVIVGPAPASLLALLALGVGILVTILLRQRRSTT